MADSDLSHDHHECQTWPLVMVVPKGNVIVVEAVVGIVSSF